MNLFVRVLAPMRAFTRRLALLVLVLPALALAQTAPIPEPELGDLASLLLQAVAGRQYVLLVAVALLIVVYVLRKVGSKVMPWLGTPRGGAVLSAAVSTLAVLVGALAAGQPLTPGLLVSAVMMAFTTAGAWSVPKNLLAPAPVPAAAPAECSIADAAQGKCKP